MSNNVAPPDAFFSRDELDDAALPSLDRSRLELYGNCPASGRIVDLGLVNTASDAANSGNEAHAALATLVDLYVDSGRFGDEMPLPEMVDILAGEMFKARPDVQPDVIDALKYSIWPFCRFLNEIGSARIAKYQGGKAEKSGQLGWNIPSLGVCVTSELDLLYIGPSKKVLHELDYKSGHKHWTAKDVERAFQFTTHAVLVLNAFPEVDVLEVGIWNTRSNSPTYPTEFHRKNLPQYEARVYTAAANYKAYRDKPLEVVPCWPSKEKCRLCDGRVFCPIRPPSACADDPAAFVGAMVAVEAKLDGMREEAIDHVRLTGADIVTPDGDAFGFEKPSRSKPKAALYSALGVAVTTTKSKTERPARARKPRKETISVDDDALLDEVFANLNKSDQP